MYILLFYIQYSIQAYWWTIYSGLPQRPLIFLRCLWLIDIKSVRSISGTCAIRHLSFPTKILVPKYFCSIRHISLVPCNWCVWFDRFHCIIICWPCYCTVHVVILFCDRMWSFEWKKICRFLNAYCVMKK
jgi:hypothetical protein